MEPLKLFYVVHADIVTTVPQKEIFVAKTTDASASSDDVTPEKAKNSEEVSEHARKETRRAAKRRKSCGGEQKTARSKTRRKCVGVDASREKRTETKDTSEKESVSQNTANESPKKVQIKRNDSSNVDEDLKSVEQEVSDQLSEKQTEENIFEENVEVQSDAVELSQPEQTLTQSQPDAENNEGKRNVAVTHDPDKHCSDELQETLDVSGQKEKEKLAESASGYSEKSDTATGVEDEHLKNCTVEEEGKSNCSSENILISKTIEPTENGKETDTCTPAVQAEVKNTCSTQTGDVTQSVRTCETPTSSPSDQKKADSENATTQNQSEVKSSKKTKSVEVQTDSNSAAQKVATASSSRPQQQTYASPDSTSVTSAPPSSANISGSAFAKKYRLPSKSRSKPQKSRSRATLGKPAADVISSSDPYRFDDGEQVSAAVPLASCKRESRDAMTESVPAAKQRKLSAKSNSSSAVKKARNSSPRQSAGVKRVSAKPVQEDDVRSSTEPESKLPRISKQVPPLKLKLPSSLHASTKSDYVMTAPLAASGRDNNSPPRILVRFSRERSKSSGSAQEERKPKQHNRRRTSSGVMRLPDVTKRKQRPSDVTVKAKPKISTTANQNSAASGSKSSSGETSTQVNTVNNKRSDANKKQAASRKKRVSSTFSRPPHRPLTARERLDAIAELRNEMATHTPRSGLDLLSRASEKFSTLLEEKRKEDAASRARTSQAPASSQKQTVTTASTPDVSL